MATRLKVESERAKRHTFTESRLRRENNGRRVVSVDNVKACDAPVPSSCDNYVKISRSLYMSDLLGFLTIQLDKRGVSYNQVDGKPKEGPKKLKNRMFNHVKKVHIDNKCDGPPPEEIKILLAEEGEGDFNGKLWTLKIFHDHMASKKRKD